MSNPLAAATDANSNYLATITVPCSLTYGMDNESNSESSDLASAEDVLPHPAFNPSPDSPKPGTISQIIQTLLHQPLTPFQHEEIEAASGTLIRFVDDISSRLKDD